MYVGLTGVQRCETLGGALNVSYLDSSMSWPVPRANRLGHYGSQILISAIVGSIALVLWPLPPDQLIALVAPLTLLQW